MTDKNYPFIEESIRPGWQRYAKRIMKKIGSAALAGIVFGAVAAGSYYIVNRVLSEEEPNNSKSDISLVVATEEPEKTTEKPDVEKNDDAQKNLTDGKNDDKITGNIQDNKPGVISDDTKKGISDYSQMYREIYDYCDSYKSVIVTIAKTTRETDYFENQIGYTSSFYGLILQKDGNSIYILTDYDNIDGKSTYNVVLDEGISADASLIGLDEGAGIAVLTADMTDLKKEVVNKLDVAKLGSSMNIGVGDMIVAIGNPMGTMGSVGYGYVCSEPKIEYLMDRSVHIYSCNMPNVDDGRGIIMNTKGNVVGVMTHRFSSDLSLCNFMGISDLKIIIEQLMNNHSRMSMGIIPRDVAPDYIREKNLTTGVYVSEISSGSAAMEAGIIVGDIITMIDKKPVKNVGDYMKILSEYGSGSEVSVQIYREYAGKSEIKEVMVKLDEIY